MSAEKEVRRRLASRSSRFAREAGIEIVRRTALIESEYELGGMTRQAAIRGSALPRAVLRSVSVPKTQLGHGQDRQGAHGPALDRAAARSARPLHPRTAGGDHGQGQRTR